MRQRLDVGTLLLGLGATLVLIALFLDWYTPGGTAWESFEVVDLLLAAMAVAAIVLAARRLSAGEAGTPAWMQGLALATLVVVAAELIQPPPGLRGAERELGGWLALAGSLVMVAGAILHFASISISIDVAERDRRRRVAAVDRRRRAPASPGDEPTTRAAGGGGATAADPEDDPGQRTMPLRPLSEDPPRD